MNWEKLEKVNDKTWQELVDRAMAMLKADASNETGTRMLLVLTQSIPARRPQAPDVWAKVYDQTNKSIQIAKVYAEVLFKGEQFSKCAEILRTLYQVNPHDAAVRQMLLTVLDKLKKNEELARLAEGWLAESQDDREKLAYRNILLNFYEESKQYDKRTGCWTTGSSWRPTTS